MQDGDYLAISNLSDLRLQHAARALTYQRLAIQLHFDLPFAELPAVARQLFLRRNSRAEAERFSVFKLTASFSQALRLNLLNIDSQYLRPTPEKTP
jgi:hypothetical protein